MKEEFQQFWDYVSPWWAGAFLDGWCRRASYSQIELVKRVARMLRGHRGLILNWFRARNAFFSGGVEGFNGKARVSTEMACGFATFKNLQTVLDHRLGDLPEPEFTNVVFLRGEKD